MAGLKTELEIESAQEFHSNLMPISFHPSFYRTHKKMQNWISRFPQFIESSIINDLYLLHLVASKKFLDHRSPSHLFRIVLSIYTMQRKLLRSATFSANQRHLEFRWTPASLLFPFSSKSVMGCLIAFNGVDRYESFDEENIVLALQKHLPDLRLVKESSYHHSSQHKNLKIFYFEVERRDGLPFSLQERSLLKNNIEEKVKNSIRQLSPIPFLGNNEEEIFKNILVLSQEIQSPEDLPQACINLDHETEKEFVFRVTLVYVSPFHRFSLKECFLNGTFISQIELTVRQLDDHPIEAHLFYLHLPRDASLVRSNGSLDFYGARQKVAALITTAIGEFRDFNGGIIIKQQEMLQSFKERFPKIVNQDSGILETFFYAITPMEKQVVLKHHSLDTLFSYFLENRKLKLPKDTSFSFHVYQHEEEIFLVVHLDNSIKNRISAFLKEQSFKTQDITYNIVEAPEGVFFNCIFSKEEIADPFIVSLKQCLNEWRLKMKNRQVLRIASEYSLVSLDPRIAGGDASSGDLLGMLFEGLTRFDKKGHVINAAAESIELSSDSRQYTFKLRRSLWNDGSSVSAYDFEYAWKKILSPDFKTAFAYLFYPIKNAREAKERKVSQDKIGIHVLDDHTLKVELVQPTPYFLQLTANTIYSPVHRIIDQQFPQWPYQCEKNYPCNGPFQLKINQPNQGYQFIKNPFYWDVQNIALDEISITLMNAVQAFQAFQNKELDWIGNPFGAWHPFYNAGKEDEVISFPNSLVYWWVFNIASPPFNNHKLRQAFAYAIQRAQIIAGAFMPLTPAYSLLPSFEREKTRVLFPDYDPDVAQKLFHETLQELNLSPEYFSSIQLFFHEKGIREYTALCLQRQLKECLGITLKLEPISYKNLFNKTTKGDFQMGLIHWTSRHDEPLNTLHAFKSAKENINLPKWENLEYQRLLNLSDQEANLFQRSSYLCKAEDLLSKEMPIIPLFYQPSQLLVRKNFQVNYKIPGGPFNLARSFYKKEDT